MKQQHLLLCAQLLSLDAWAEQILQNEASSEAHSSQPQNVSAMLMLLLRV